MMYSVVFLAIQVSIWDGQDKMRENSTRTFHSYLASHTTIKSLDEKPFTNNRQRKKNDYYHESFLSGS